jgi:uncharacterized protein (TIGR03437 family)
MTVYARVLASCAAMSVGALVLLDHPCSVRAQQPAHSQIASISVSTDQKLTYPNAAPAPYLADFPDEHMTFFPPAPGSSAYLLFGSSSVVGTGPGETVVLESTDLQNFKFATDLGYKPLVMATPVDFNVCNPTYDTEFDENYAGPGSVLQDPTLPTGNLIMLYEAENHCPSGVNQFAAYGSTGFTRSSDNGKTWPASENGPMGGANRYPVIQSADPQPSTPHPNVNLGNFAGAGFIDKSTDGNYYLYATYQYFGAAEPQGWVRVARAPLGENHPTFKKWYNGSFSQPGLGGLSTGVVSQACGYQGQASISYVDDIGLYLLTFFCSSGSGNSATAAWYYSTATSLDIQDWTTPKMIANTQFPITACNGQSSAMFDGYYPSFMSPGAAPGHLKLTGTVFLMDCMAVPRTLKSRTFTIATQPQPAPVLTAGTLANGATYVSGGLVPGSWAQVKGTGLSNITRLWAGYDFIGLGSNLPTSLSGVQVMVNNIPAAVYYVSATQVDFQVPSGISGTASVQVINNGAASNTLTASAPTSAPGLFPNAVNGVNYPAAIYASGQFFVGPAGVPGYLPASPGFHIELYATGLLAAPGGVLPTAAAISGVTVTIGTVTVPADFAGQTPYVGEFQINFTVPQQFATLPAAEYPITISVNGVSSPPTVVIPVRP